MHAPRKTAQKPFCVFAQSSNLNDSQRLLSHQHLLFSAFRNLCKYLEKMEASLL